MEINKINVGGTEVDVHDARLTNGQYNNRLEIALGSDSSNLKVVIRNDSLGITVGQVGGKEEISIPGGFKVDMANGLTFGTMPYGIKIPLGFDGDKVKVFPTFGTKSIIYIGGSSSNSINIGTGGANVNIGGVGVVNIGGTGSGIVNIGGGSGDVSIGVYSTKSVYISGEVQIDGYNGISIGANGTGDSVTIARYVGISISSNAITFTNKQTGKSTTLTLS